MNKVKLLIICLASTCCVQTLYAERLNSNTQQIRIRLGDNSFNSINTVIYNAGIPNELTGVPGVTASPQTISTNNIAGASGIYTVRIVTDLNLRNSSPNTATSLTGIFTYDSSSPMTCMTTATCGTTPILFDKISWTTRDADTHATPTTYTNSISQPAQIQTDTNPANGATLTRHRNYFQFSFDNDTLLPAGTYEGTIEMNGEGVFTF